MRKRKAAELYRGAAQDVLKTMIGELPMQVGQGE